MRIAAPSSAARAGLSLCLSLLALLGCEGPGPVITLGPRPPRPVHVAPDDDAGAPLPEGAVACSSDADCADSIECTVDECLPAGYCSNRLDNALCSDGSVCNGVESCDPLQGCITAPAPTCDDQDPCTIDRCDEAAKDCVHDIRDFDGDGEADFHCGGGTDCDDFDPLRGTEAREVCNDGVDNDCDDRLDEADCGALPYDTCADPLDVSAGGVFEVPSVGALRDYALSCQDEITSRDLVFRFTLDEPRDARFVALGLRADGGQDIATLALQSTCGASDGELQCEHGFPDLRVRALPAGEYFLVAATSVAARSLLLQIELEPATPTPTNLACESAQDISAGGHVTADFVDIPDNVTSSCAISGQPELYYRVVLQQPQDLEVSVIGDEDGTMAVALRSGGCGPQSREERCEIGPRVLSYFHQLAPGEYTLIVEGPSSPEIGFGLDIAVLPPTPPPSGDSCEPAQPLVFGEPQTISLVGLQDDIETLCESTGPDAVLSFTLDARQDLDIRVEAKDYPALMALQTTCSDPLSERVCREGQPLSTRLHDVAPGAYFMVIDSPMGTDVTVRVDLLPPTPTTPVSANDTCFDATLIPPEGGIFSGDTSTLNNDYDLNYIEPSLRCGNGAAARDAAFRLELTAKKRVIARVDSSVFDSVLLRYDAPQPGQPLCASLNPVCDDDSGGTSDSAQLDEELPAGIYYYIVDGYAANVDDPKSSGVYLFDVTVTEPRM
ncbi:MAG: putative metal-binding motif-containing protein [Polyangiales bacterium]